MPVVNVYDVPLLVPVAIQNQVAVASVELTKLLGKNFFRGKLLDQPNHDTLALRRQGCKFLRNGLDVSHC